MASNKQVIFRYIKGKLRPIRVTLGAGTYAGWGTAAGLTAAKGNKKASKAAQIGGFGVTGVGLGLYGAGAARSGEGFMSAFKTRRAKGKSLKKAVDVRGSKSIQFKKASRLMRTGGRIARVGVGITIAGTLVRSLKHTYGEK